MYEKQIHLEPGQRLTLAKMNRDVAITCWDEAHVLVGIQDGGEEHLTIEATEDGPSLSSTMPCKVRVPAALPVTVRHAQANLKASGLADLNVEQVRGNLKLDDAKSAIVAEVYGNFRVTGGSSLRLVGSVYGNTSVSRAGAVHLQNVRGNARIKAAERLNLARVGGNLRAKQIEGTVDAEKVGGNAFLSGIAGKVTLDQVAGNLAARDLVGGSRVSRIGGNLAFSGGLGRGCTYHFSADGNAAVRLDEGTGAHITLTARGPMICTCDLTDEERQGHTLTGTLGDGGSEIVIEARGSAVLSGSGGVSGSGLNAEVTRQMEGILHSIPDLAAVSRQVEESLSAIDLEAIGRQVNQEVEQALSRLRVKLESVDWDRVGHRTETAVNRAMERLQRDMDRFAEKSARRQERLDRQAQRDAERLTRMERRHQTASTRHQPVDAEAADWPDQDWGEEVATVPDESVPDLDEERMSILKMVEQGQITPAEAEMLLDALG